ncbi:unnamed protein product, partial [Owenia fusiformis]
TISVTLVDIEVLKKHDTTTAVAIMKGLGDPKAETHHHIILCRTKENLQHVLKLANMINRLDQHNFWLTVFEDFRNIDVHDLILNKLTNLVVIKKSYTTENDVNMCDIVVAVFGTNKIKIKLEEAYVYDGIRFFAEGIRGILKNHTNETDILDNTNTAERGLALLSTFEQLHIKGLLDGTHFVDGYHGNTNVDICTAYGPPLSRFKSVATWSREISFVPKENIFPNTWKGFGNVTLTIATREAIPFTIKLAGNETRYQGLCFDILDELASRLNFRYKLVEPPDRKWGGKNPDGTWNGMVGMVMRGEAAFAVGPFTITSARAEVIDFTKAFMEDGAGIILKKPIDKTPSVLKIFRPFKEDVWLLISGGIALIGFVVYFFSFTTPYSGYRRGLAGSSKYEISLLENLWLVYGSCLQQGTDVFPRALSSRLVMIAWWVFAIVIIATYTANLAALLTVQLIVTPIKNLEELVDQSDIRPLAKDGSNLYDLFKGSSEDTVYGKVWKMMENGPKITENPDAYRLVLHENYAFMGDKSQLEYKVLTECREFALADTLFNTAGYGFVFPKQSPYLSDFSKNIVRLQEAGLVERWKQKWWQSRDECTNNKEQKVPDPLNIQTLSGAFATLALASFVASIVVAIECVCFKRRRRDNDNT